MIVENNEADFDLEKSYNESFKDIEENTIITALVIDIDSDIVFLDLGYKSEAKLQLSEFDQKPAIGDEIEIYLERLEGKNGDPIVSKRKCDYIKEKEELMDFSKNKELVQGKIVDIKRNGFVVRYKLVKGFIPFHLFDFKKIENPASLKNSDVKFYIEKVKNSFPGKNAADNFDDFFANRKLYLREKNKIEKENFFNDQNIGDVLEGTVKNILPYGAFINLGPVEALLHIKDISWVKIDKIEDVLAIGDQIKVKILSIDTEKKRIAVGLKQTEEEPWSKFLKQYKTDDVVKGTVTSIVSYGAFIKIIDGVEGLLHISDMSWTKNIKKPSELLQKGQQAEVKIISIAEEERKISLSLKHLLENPWDQVDEKYKIGTRVTGKIKTITSFGVFVELEEGIEALMHRDDISWTDKIFDPFEYFKGKEETEIDVVVIQLDSKSNKIKVGMKQLSDDPWMSVKDTIQRNDTVECVIEEIDEEKGLKVMLNQMPVIIPISEVDFGKEEDIKSDLNDKFKVGDKITAVVQNIDIRKRAVNLSIKNFFKIEERKKIQEFLHDHNEDAKFTLEDMMKSKNDE